VSKDKRKLPKRLFRAPDRASSYEEARSSSARMKHAARDHQDVLQNIEFVLVKLWRQDPAIDDRAATTALRASLAGREPDDPRAAELFRSLAEIRAMRADVPEDVWRGCLRTVDDSVRRHSDRRPGETGYLRFASQFIV
jgi:hypothetical protein